MKITTMIWPTSTDRPRWLWNIPMTMRKTITTRKENTAIVITTTMRKVNIATATIMIMRKVTAMRTMTTATIMTMRKKDIVTAIATNMTICMTMIITIIMNTGTSRM